MAKPIKEALGLGERLQLGGAHVDCVPACLADLDTAMELYTKSLGRTWKDVNGVTHYGLTIQGCYHPEHREEAKPALEELLYIACGRKIPQEELLQKVNVADGGKEVLAFIDRFLGFEPRNTTTETQQG